MSGKNAKKKKQNDQRIKAVAGIAAIVVALVSVIVHFARSPSPEETASSDPASAPRQGPSLQELSDQMRESSLSARKSPEYLEAAKGDLKALVARYELTNADQKPRESRRVELIRLIGTGFELAANEHRAIEASQSEAALGFLRKLCDSPDVRKGALTAPIAQTLAKIGSNPAYSGKAASMLLKLHRKDKRPGSDGEILMALGKIDTNEGIDVLVRSAKSGSRSIKRPALYGLASRLKGKSDATARKALLDIASAKDEGSPLAVKILAKDSDKRVVRFIPRMLDPKASDTENEAAIYAVQAFKLSEHQARLRKLIENAQNPIIREQALRALADLGGK